MPKVLRISRHPADAARLTALRRVFGADVEVVETDFPYGADPVAAVKAEIEKLGDVVACEPIGPFPVLMKLVDGRRELDVQILRAEYQRGPEGRVLVVGKDENGRDLFAFDHYEELVRIVFQTNPL